MFNWFKKLFVRSTLEDPSVSLTDPSAWRQLSELGATGTPVSYKIALGYPPVARGVKLLSSYCAKPPLVFYNKNSEGRNKNTNHPGFRAIKHPGNNYTSNAFRRQMTAFRISCGNSYAYIYRDEFAQALGFQILNPDFTWIEGDKVKTYLRDQVWSIPYIDVFHLRDLSSDGGIEGDRLVSIARDALGLSITLQQFAATYFRNATLGKFVVELPPAIGGNLQKIKEFAEQWRAANPAGLETWNKITFAPPGTKVNEVGDSGETSQFIEAREFDLIQVGNLLGINPAKLGASLNTSYGSLEMDQKNFLSDCLDPLLIEWEEECEAKLLTEAEKQSGSVYVEAERKALLQIDSNTETNLIVTQVNNGLMSVEEGRRKLNLPPETEDETYRRPANIVIEGEEPPPEPPPAPTPQPKLPVEPEEDQRFKALTEKAVGRILKRLQKSVESGPVELEKHREVLRDSLDCFDNAEQWIDSLFSRIEPELKEVLPEQRHLVFERLDIQKESEVLWKSE